MLRVFVLSYVFIPAYSVFMCIVAIYVSNDQ